MGAENPRLGSREPLLCRCETVSIVPANGPIPGPANNEVVCLDNLSTGYKKNIAPFLNDNKCLTAFLTKV